MGSGSFSIFCLESGYKTADGKEFLYIHFLEYCFVEVLIYALGQGQCLGN